MGVIFSLSGCKAVGKTTLLREIKNKLPNIIIREGFRKFDMGFDTSIEEQFYENERCYIRREIEEYKIFRESKSPALLLRGAEDLEFYALHYPKIIGTTWDVEHNLRNELAELRKCSSDYILYLDVDLEIINQRKNHDATKTRNNMKNWLENWQPFIEDYIKANPKTTILNTNKMSAKEVLTWSLKWILERI